MKLSFQICNSVHPNRKIRKEKAWPEEFLLFYVSSCQRTIKNNIQLTSRQVFDLWLVSIHCYMQVAPSVRSLECNEDTGVCGRVWGL